MPGKFLRRSAIVDTIKSEERANAIQKREGTRNHVRVTACQCRDPHCGAWHTIVPERVLPTSAEADVLLKEHNKVKRSRNRGRRA